MPEDTDREILIDPIQEIADQIKTMLRPILAEIAEIRTFLESQQTKDQRQYDPDQLLSVRDIMGLLSRSEPFVQRILKEGHLEGVKVGGDWRVSRSALRSFITRCADQSGNWMA